ncbi:hypothetical protein GEMRC1_004097 [Eukaryota sp. GEM-RC1]
MATSFQIFSGFVNFKFENEVHSVSIPSFDLYNGELSITGGHFSFTEVFVHNSTTGTSVSFSDTSSLNIDHFTAINSNVQFSIDEDSDHVFDVFVFQETDFTSSSDKLQFNNLTLIDSKRLGSGNVSADWLSIHGSEFNGNSFTKCFGRCFVDNEYSNVISILGGHDLIFDGESLFSSYSVQVVFVLESSNFKLSGTSKIHGHVLIDDDDSSNFQISGETEILSGGSLEVKKVIDLTGVLTVAEGELILKESNSIQGQLSILELGNASESLFTLHSNSLELLDKDVVVTVKGSFKGVEFFNHTVGEFNFSNNSKIDTDTIILHNSALLNVVDAIFETPTSFQIFSGFVDFKYPTEVHLVSIPSFDLYNGDLSISRGDFSFTEVFVHNSTTGTSVSFSDTSLLHIDHFIAINSNVKFSIDEDSDHVFDVFVFQETDFTSSSNKLQFNNLTLIDSKRLGSGNVSADWLSIHGSEFNGNSFTKCFGRCFVDNEYSNTISILGGHDLIFDGESLFSSYSVQVVFVLESSNFKLSGTSKIHGHILIDDDDSSIFQISGETEILSGGSLEVKKVIDLTGVLTVTEGELILKESNSIQGQLSILELGNASESLFTLHSNSLELLDKDVVVTVKGSFKGVEFFNHTVGEFNFSNNSKIDTDTIILHNSALLNVVDAIFETPTSFQIFSGFVDFKYPTEVHLVSIPSFDLYNGDLSISRGDFSFTEVFVHNSTTGTSVSFSDTSLLHIDHFTAINSNVKFSIDEDFDHVFDVFVFQETDFTSSSNKLQFNNLTLIDSKRLGSGNVSADWLSIHGSEFNGNSFTKCFGRCFVDNEYSNTMSILGGHDLIFDGESLFSSYSVQVVFVLESSNFKLSGTSKIHGHILIDDDDSSIFQISGETQILSGGSLEVKKVIDLTGVLTVAEGELILKESNSIQGQLSILELGNASESLFTLHSNSLELLDKNVVVTVKGSFTGVEFFNHTVGEFNFSNNSKIDTDTIILHNSAVLNVVDAIFETPTSFQIFSGFVDFKYPTEVHLVSIPSFDLYNGDLSISRGDFSFTEVFVHNSTTGTSVSFSDTSLLHIDHFTAINSNVKFSIDEDSDHVFDVFVFQETDFTSSSNKLQFNNLTLIDSKRLGSGNVSADWLSIHGSEFNGNSFTKCFGRCFVDNEYSNTMSILGGHDLIFDGESLFSSYSVQVVFVLESSNFKLSGTSKIHGHILIDDDDSSIFQISGETQILSGGSLEVKKVIDLTGVLTVTEGEIRKRNFSGDDYSFESESLFTLHSNSLELLDKDVVITVQGSFTGVEFFNHTVGEFNFSNNSKIDTDTIILHNSAVLNVVDAIFETPTSFQIFSGFVDFKYPTEVHLVSIPSVDLYNGELSITGGDFSFTEVFVHNSTTETSVSFSDTSLLHIDHFTAINSNVQFSIDEDSDHVFDVFVFQETDFTSSSDKLQFNNLTLIDSKRLGSGNVSADWLSIHGSEFNGNSFTKCFGRCFVDNEYSNTISILGGHDLIFLGESLFSSYSVQVVFVLESSNFKLSGTSKIHGHVLIDDDDSSNFQISGETEILSGGSLEVKKVIDLTGVLTVTEGELILEESNSIQGQLSILELGNVIFSGDDYSFESESLFILHSNSLELLDKDVVVTVKGSFTGVEFFNHTVGEFNFSNNSKIDTDTIILHNSAVLNVVDAIFETPTSFQIFSGFVDFQYPTEVHLVSIPSVDLYNGDLSITGGDFSFTEVFVHNSTTETSVSFSDTSLLHIDHFTAINSNVQFSIDEDSDHVFDVFVFQETDFTSSSNKLQFNNLTLIDSKRLGSGNVSADWLSIHGSEFNGNSFTKCFGRCFVDNEYSNTISILGGHDLIFDGESLFSSYSVQVVFVLESSNFKLSGTSKIHGHVLIDDDDSSNFQISGETEILSGGSLEVKKVIDLTGVLTVTEGESIINSRIRKRNFFRRWLFFESESLFILHSNSLELLDKDVVVTVKGSFTGVEFFNHTVGEFNFSNNSKIDTDTIILHNSAVLNVIDAIFETPTSFQIFSGFVDFKYPTEVHLVSIPSFDLYNGDLSITGGDFSFNEVFVHNSTTGTSVSFSDTSSLNIDHFTVINSNVQFSLDEDSDHVFDVFVFQETDFTSSSDKLQFNNLTLIDSKRLGSGNVSADWLSIHGSEFNGNSFTKCFGRCFVDNDYSNVISILGGHDLIFDGESLFSSYSVQVVFVLETSNFKLSGTSKIHGHILIDDDDSSFFRYLERLKFCPESESLFTLHSNSLELLDKNVVVTVKGSFTGVEFFNHTVGEFNFSNNSKIDTDTIILHNSAVLNVVDAIFETPTSFQIFSGFVDFKYLTEVHPVSIPSFDLYNGDLSISRGDFSFTEVFVHNSTTGTSVSFSDTSSLNIDHFTAINSNVQFSIDEDSGHVFDVFVFQETDFTSSSDKLQFNNLTLIDSKRLGSGNVSADWLSIHGSEFNGNSFTKCFGRCFVDDEYSNVISILGGHDLIFDGESLFSSYSVQVVFVLESSNFKLSGTSKIHGHVLIDDDDSSNFQISGETEILSGGSLDVKKVINLTGVLTVTEGELILKESNSIQGQLSILELGNAVFSGDDYSFESESLFTLHSNSLELLDKNVVVTVKGSFTGVEFFNHTVGEFNFSNNSKIDTDTIILHNSAVLNVVDAIFETPTSFQIFSGFVDFKYLTEVHPVSIPSFDLYNGDLSISRGDFSFTEVFVHNSTTGTSVSFSDTSSLNIDHFTAINSNVQFSIDEDSGHVFDVFVFQETDFTSSSDKLQFNNLTLIDSKRLGSGNVSANWLSIHGSEFNGNSFTKCFGRCFVDDEYSNVISILGGHDLIFDGESLFSSYSVQVVFVLESSNFKLSGTSKIHGHVLIDDDDSSNFQISGETEILSGGSLDVKKVIDLTGVLTVAEGELILKESNSIQGQLSILELGNAVFSGDDYSFESESLFTLHSNSLELLDKNVVVTVKGSFTGVEFFNHTVGEFNFSNNSKIDTDTIILHNSAVLNVVDAIFETPTSFQIFSGFVDFKYLTEVHPVSIPSFDLYNGDLSISRGDFSFTEVFVHNSTTGTSVSFSDTSSLNIDHFTAINSNVQFSIDEDSGHVFDVFVFQETDFTSSSDKLQFNNLTLIDSKRLGSGNVSADWLSIHGSEFNGNSFTKCFGRCFVDDEYSNIISILGGHDLIFLAHIYVDSIFIEICNSLLSFYSSVDAQLSTFVLSPGQLHFHSPVEFNDCSFQRFQIFIFLWTISPISRSFYMMTF